MATTKSPAFIFQTALLPDTQRLDSRHERGGLYPQEVCSPSGPVDLSASLFERGFDVFPVPSLSFVLRKQTGVCVRFGTVTVRCFGSPRRSRRAASRRRAPPLAAAAAVAAALPQAAQGQTWLDHSSVSRLTPPSNLYTHGDPDLPMVSRFIQGQRFDLQASLPQ